MPQGNKPPTSRTSRNKLQKQIYIEFRYWNFSVTDNKSTMFLKMKNKLKISSENGRLKNKLAYL